TVDDMRVKVGFERLSEAADLWADQQGAAAQAWAGLPGPTAMLTALFGNSPHLTDLAIKHFDLVRRCWDCGPDDAFTNAIEPLLDRSNTDLTVDATMALLRTAKQRASLVIALADIANLWPLERITQALSQTADLCLSLAIRILLFQADARGDLELPDKSNPEKGSGYVVLAMGKLGACELNYSSDIDLIVLFNLDKIRSARPERLPQTFHRITRDLVRIMEERTAQGYVFRTDLRLRPDPGSTPIALSSAAAELYYASLARTWERAAMIKARPCAGDVAEGKRFLTEIAPFIWRVSMDFAVVEEITDMRARVASRAAKGARQAGGFNVKLGAGGIRDIEFFVQTHQLVFGGREVQLRTPRTLDGLRALARSGRIEQTVADDLAEAYRYWRRLEHRLQMVDDRQTHLMPDAPEEIEHIAFFLGYVSHSAFERRLGKMRRLVEKHVVELFDERRHRPVPAMSFEGADPDLDTLDELQRLGFAKPESAFSTVNGWMRGRARATRADRGRLLLARLAPTLLERIADTGDPGATLTRWDRFIAGLPAGIQLFSLLSAHPELIDLLTDLLSSAPIIADGLTSRPEQLDALLLPDFLTDLPGSKELSRDLDSALSVSRHHEEGLSIIRRWMNDQRLRAAVHLLRDPSRNSLCSLFLSQAVDTALSRLLPLVEQDFAERHGKIDGAGIAVLGLGKLGSSEMAIGSDLDLILVYDAPSREAHSDGEKPLNTGLYFARLTQRFITAITAPMKVGTLFELDMRLRPSGNAGPLATPLDGFVKYQKSDAWTWEHMALTRARVVAGDRKLASRIRRHITRILRRRRDRVSLLADVISMRERITDQFGTDDPWDVKYARGGLIDISFVVQYFQLLHAADRPDILEPSTGSALMLLAEADILDRNTVEELSAMCDLCLQIQAYMRVAYGRQSNVADAEPQTQRGLARIVLGLKATARDFE
ncbi:MAG: bifunctional [glutamine synthetase] adenylyltransferase/[glutamine synthetase]-adenylyl-L-tyrosine phosphorylase, partial [Pseudomonadota bacterium]